MFSKRGRKPLLRLKAERDLLISATVNPSANLGKLRLNSPDVFEVKLKEQKNPSEFHCVSFKRHREFIYKQTKPLLQAPLIKAVTPIAKKT